MMKMTNQLTSIVLYIGVIQLFFFLLLVDTTFANNAYPENTNNNNNNHLEPQKASQEKPLCRLKDKLLKYAYGQWIHKTSIEDEETFECCDGHEQYDLPICKQPESPKVYDHACACRNYYYDHHPENISIPYRPELGNYKWYPDECSIPMWDAKHFVRRWEQRKS